MDIFDSLIELKAGYGSLRDRNAANLIATHITVRWPALTAIRGLWFTGSQVWEHLYGRKPSTFSDLDMFELGGFGAHFRRSPIAAAVRALSLTEAMRVPKGSRPNGRHYLRPDGRMFDMWRGKPTVVATLQAYPSVSHAHCRAAFSFTEGLVVLPNEAAE